MKKYSDEDYVSVTEIAGGWRSEVGGQKIVIASRKEPNVDGLVKSQKIPFSVLLTF